MRTTTLLLSALIATPSLVCAQQTTFEELREQGVLYFQRGHHKQARATLEEAAATPQGAKDFRTAYYLARALAELLDYAEAYVAIGKAIGNATSDEERAEADALRAEVKSLVGPVRFRSAGDATTGRIDLESKTGTINKKKQQIISSVQTRLRAADVNLPATVYLPYGEYVANGVAFSLKAPSRAEVEVPLGPPVEDEGDGTVWWWVGGGAVAAAAIGVGAYFLFAGDEGGGDGPPTYDVRFDSLGGR